MGLFDNFGMEGPIENPGLLGRLGNAAHTLHNNPHWQQVQARTRGENPYQNQLMQAQVQAMQGQQVEAAEQAKWRVLVEGKLARGEKITPFEAMKAGVTPAEFKLHQPNAGVASPSSVREYEYFNNLSDEEKKAFLGVKRAQQVKDFGGYHGIVGPDGEVQNIGDKTLKPDQELSYIENAAVAREQGQARGEALVSAEGDIAKAEQFIDLIDKAIEHPGREAATGLSSMGNRFAIPGTDRKDFLVLQDQLSGNNFLEAYETLKGGGQITQIEGIKAEQAQARFNAAQSEEEFLAALTER